MRSSRSRSGGASPTRSRGVALACAALLAASAARAGPLVPGDLVVADRQGLAPARLLRVDPASGAAQSFYTAFDGVVAAPRDVEVDVDGSVFVSQSGVPTKPAIQGLYRIDAASGAVVPISEGGIFDDIRGFAIDAVGDLLVVDRGTAYGIAASVIRVDGLTGVQTRIATAGNLHAPQDVVVQGDGKLLVLDGGTGSGARLVRIIPTTGAQTVVLDAGPIGKGPGGIALEPDGRALVSDAFGKLYRVNPSFAAFWSLGSIAGAFVMDLAVEANGDGLLLSGGGDDHIHRFSGGVFQPLATRLQSPQGIAVVPPRPLCEIAASAASYGNGQTLTLATLRFAHAMKAPRQVRIRLALKPPGIAEIGVLDVVVTLPGWSRQQPRSGSGRGNPALAAARDLVDPLCAGRRAQRRGLGRRHCRVRAGVARDEDAPATRSRAAHSARAAGAHAGGPLRGRAGDRVGIVADGAGSKSGRGGHENQDLLSAERTGTDDRSLGDRQSLPDQRGSVSLGRRGSRRLRDDPARVRRRQAPGRRRPAGPGRRFPPCAAVHPAVRARDAGPVVAAIPGHPDLDHQRRHVESDGLHRGL